MQPNGANRQYMYPMTSSRNKVSPMAQANQNAVPPVARRRSTRASVPDSQAQLCTDCLGSGALGTTLRWWSPFIALVLLGPLSVATLVLCDVISHTAASLVSPSPA
eukprot:g9922.t1